MSEECLFCQIASYKVPSTIRFEDAEIIAFNDIAPKAPVHILIVPKTHIESISTMNEDEASIVSRLVIVAKRIANDIDMTDFRLVFNSGIDAGMGVDHLHMHLIGGKKLGSIA